MDLSSVLDRFTGRTFVLYGGDEEVVKQIQPKGNILTWYTTRYDETSNPPAQLYTRFLQNMEDVLKDRNSTSPVRNSIIIIVGNGYVGGLKAEMFASRVFRYQGYQSRILIFHGYPGFVTMTEDGDTVSGIVKQVYTNGCIVAPEDDRVVYLQELTSVMAPNTVVPVPLRDQDLMIGSPFTEQVKELLPYIHMISRIRQSKETSGSVRIPLTEEYPVDILNAQDRQKQKDYNPNEWTSAVHWGQRKLLMSEIELLVEVLAEDYRRGRESQQVENVGQNFLIVYVGAAPGSHIPYLLSLFSNITNIRIHVWDRPSRFDIQEDMSLPVADRLIRIVPPEFADPSMTGDYEGFFTDYVAQKYLDAYGPNNKIIFISDIRDRASEEAVHNDMSMQRRWVEKLQPYASQLKFRLPFSGQDNYEYLSGRIFTQTWSRVKSTETRLLSFRPFTTTMYNVNDYDRTMSYLNTVTRMSSYDIGRTIDVTVRQYSLKGNAPLPSTFSSGIGPYILLPEDGYCTCHDCAREAQIIAKYMGFVGFPPSVDTVSTFIHRNTEESRPRNDPTNKRTLWSRVNPKAPPSDRKNIIIYKTLPENHEQLEQQVKTLWLRRLNELNRMTTESNDLSFSDSPLDKLRITLVSKILIYGDGLSPEQIVELLLAKKDNTPYIASTETPQNVLRSVLAGARPSIVVNFHSDFIHGYNPDRDRGVVGGTIYNQFRQGLVVRQQGKGTTKIDPHGQLLLYILSFAQ